MNAKIEDNEELVLDARDVGCSNLNLHGAKATKNDEFYTLYNRTLREPSSLVEDTDAMRQHITIAKCLCIILYGIVILCVILGIILGISCFIEGASENNWLSAIGMLFLVALLEGPFYGVALGMLVTWLIYFILSRCLDNMLSVDEYIELYKQNNHNKTEK